MQSTGGHSQPANQGELNERCLHVVFQVGHMRTSAGSVQQTGQVRGEA